MKSNHQEKERKVTHQILALWSGREKEWLTYKQITSELKKTNVSERTVARYLLTLTGDGKLDKNERGYKKTFYKPREDFLKTLRPSLDWIRINEESLGRIGKYVMDVMIKTVEESGKTTKSIRKRLDKEISNLSENEEFADNVEEIVSDILAKETLTNNEEAEFYSLLKNLIQETIYFDLSSPYVLGRIVDREELASILRDNIRSVVESYMHLWAYMYKHPAALLELKQCMNLQRHVGSNIAPVKKRDLNWLIHHDKKAQA
jgi:DNA-binding transcriptional ArsR family regulator